MKRPLLPNKIEVLDQLATGRKGLRPNARSPRNQVLDPEIGNQALQRMAKKAFAQRAVEGAQKVLGPEHPDTKKYEQLLRELLAKEG